MSRPKQLTWSTVAVLLPPVPWPRQLVAGEAAVPVGTKGPPRSVPGPAPLHPLAPPPSCPQRAGLQLCSGSAAARSRADWRRHGFEVTQSTGLSPSRGEPVADEQSDTSSYTSPSSTCLLSFSLFRLLCAPAALLRTHSSRPSALPLKLKGCMHAMCSLLEMRVRYMHPPFRAACSI